MGPVSLSVVCLLLLASPLLRGGNRHAALIVLEALGLFVVAAFCIRSLRRGGAAWTHRGDAAAEWILLLSPAIFALVYLLPVPLEFWASTPGRAIYLQTMRDVGVALPERLPLSLVPEATITSLLAGIPLIAAFLVGRRCSVAQLKVLSWLVVLIAFGQVAFGLMQISGGVFSPFYFGAGGGRPIGTFANSNHYANYLATVLALYVWLGWASVTSRHRAARNLNAWWVAGGLVLVLGILMSRSRGAALSGLPMAAIGLAWVMAARRGATWGKYAAIGVPAAILVGAGAFLGLDAVVSRFSVAELTSSASFRSALTQSTLAGAAEFWPWGAGWGVYGAVFPRFQPPSIPGATGYAHQDYAQMLFEGGAFSLVLAAAFLWLVTRRAVELARRIARHRATGPGAVAAALCGMGLLGFLLHSLVEFNMHIPANAILASLLAGVYLRPLADAADAS